MTIEVFISAVLMLIYVFSNFRLTRLICKQRTDKRITEILIYGVPLILTEVLLFKSYSYENSSLLFPYIILSLLQYGILFLYQKNILKNLVVFVETIGIDYILATAFLLLSKHDINTADWLLFFLLLVPVKLIVILLLESAFRLREKEHISVQMQIIEHQMKIMEQSQEQIRFLKHDLKNHLLHMNQLLKDNENDELRNYLNETVQHIEVSQEFVHSGNRNIDSLLNYKLMSAHQIGTEIKTETRIPNELLLSEFDLNVILGNLLDNALEALKYSDVKHLTVSLRYDSGVMYILVQNTCNGEPSAVSVKGAGHGIGLHSVRNTIEKYHGVLKTDYQDNTFTTTVMLYLDC